MTTIRSFSAMLAVTGALAAFSSTASAQCVGDCSSDSSVTVDEIITGVNIALGTAELSTCTRFDSNGDNAVTVDEILTAINFALTGCPAGGSCGNGTVDFDEGETCDDSNTVNGDACPSDCRIEACDGSGSTLPVSVSFTPPAGVDLTALTVFVTYPDGVVRIPGLGNDALVQGRITGVPGNVSATPNDLDYALRLVAFAPDLSPITAGALFGIEFDTCQGASAPQLADFTCTVEDAADSNLEPVSGTNCALSF